MKLFVRRGFVVVVLLSFLAVTQALPVFYTQSARRQAVLALTSRSGNWTPSDGVTRIFGSGSRADPGTPEWMKKSKSAPQKAVKAVAKGVTKGVKGVGKAIKKAVTKATGN